LCDQTTQNVEAVMHINIGESIEHFMKQSYGFQRQVHEQKQSTVKNTHITYSLYTIPTQILQQS